MSGGCEICESIARFTPENPYLIGELSTGYVVLAGNQHIRGYTLFLAKQCAAELHELPSDVRSRFLEEMAQVAEAVFRAFAPRKLNYELLGNHISHLHWHLFPRYADDPNPEFPVWNNEEFLRAPRRSPIDSAELAELRERVRAALDDVGAGSPRTRA